MTDIGKLIAEAHMESELNEGAEGEYPFERITELLDALEALNGDHTDSEKALLDSVNDLADERDALAAVIEKAYEVVDGFYPPLEARAILSTADPAAVLREHDAKVLRDVAEPIGDAVLALARPFDSKGFSAVGDAYANAARFAKDQIEARADRIERGEA